MSIRADLRDEDFRCRFCGARLLDVPDENIGALETIPILAGGQWMNVHGRLIVCDGCQQATPLPVAASSS